MNLPESMRAWRVHSYGEPLDVLRCEQVPLPEVGPGELLVQIEAIPLNLNDLDRIRGENMLAPPPLPTIPGMEVMGTVVAAGAGAEAWLEKRVVALAKQAYGGFADYACCPAVSCFEMPAEIALPEAAAIYFPFHLAWLGLVDRARLRAGESVLIHAGAGGAGSAAIQLAHHLGARVIATAGGEEKLALCRELGADVAIDYHQQDFKAIVLEETQRCGVDVVFDPVGASVYEESLHCLGYGGRYLQIGFASDKSVVDRPTLTPRALSTGNLSISGLMLAYAPPALAPMMKQATGWNFIPEALGRQAMAEILELVRAKKVRAVVGRTLDFEDIPAALTTLADRGTMGRSVVRVRTA